MKRAFSLIELSIVILIIGIIIAGITQASRVVYQTKLTSARTLTQSSPVAGIKDLVTWFDSVSESSFKESESIDSTKISSWQTINPQATTQHAALQATSNNQPTYVARGINGLPSLQFDGSQTYLEIAYKSELNPTNLSFFAVIKPFAVSNYGAVFSSRSITPQKGYMLYAVPSPAVEYQFWLGDGVGSWGLNFPASAITLNKSSIISGTSDGTTFYLYDNGVSKGSAALTFVPTTTGVFRIGAGKNEDLVPQYFFNGHISEIIIFNRVLKTEERQAIEKYLGKKWALPVS